MRRLEFGWFLPTAGDTTAYGKADALVAPSLDLFDKVVQAAELAAVAKLPKQEVLIAMLLSAMQGPARGLVYTLSAVLSKFVRVIAAIGDKRKGDGDMSTTTSKLSQEDLIKAIETMSVLDLAELAFNFERAMPSALREMA